MNIGEMVKFRSSLTQGASISNEEIIERYMNFCRHNKVFRSINYGTTEAKNFKMKDRIGYHSGKKTNRNEEILCQALFNTYSKEKLILSGYTQKVVDYQTPLKEKRADKQWGKIDLVGVIIGSPMKKLCFWEVKAGDNNDTLRYALVEVFNIFFSI